MKGVFIIVDVKETGHYLAENGLLDSLRKLRLVVNTRIVRPYMNRARQCFFDEVFTNKEDALFWANQKSSLLTTK